MIIESIKIENFRGIEYLEIPTLDEHINLFVGVNGAGKTSVLDSFSLVYAYLRIRYKKQFERWMFNFYQSEKFR